MVRRLGITIQVPKCTACTNGETSPFVAGAPANVLCSQVMLRTVRGDITAMNDAPLTFVLSQNTTREQLRMRAEREHPQGMSRHEIREALGQGPSMIMQMQSLVNNLRKPLRPAPVRRTCPEPIVSCSPQA